MPATKEAPGLIESAARGAAIGLLTIGAIELAGIILPAFLVGALLNGAVIGGSIGVGAWAINKLASFARGPAKAA